MINKTYYHDSGKPANRVIWVTTLLGSVKMPGAVQKHHTKGCGPTGTLPPYCNGGTGGAWGVPTGYFILDFCC